ncbi:MAG: C39 family peptidase [Longimicrobiales bacterium]
MSAQKLLLDMSRQPDLVTCGPTCLHAAYGFFEDPPPLEEVTREVRSLEGGGTLAVMLGCHALERGYRATLFSYNLRIFDPTWFSMDREELIRRLRTRIQVKEGKKLKEAAEAYVRFLDLGGEVHMRDLSSELIRGYLDAGLPILTGLSSTYLYQAPRELGVRDDDIKGDPQGHFVVLAGYEEGGRQVLVADPLGGTQWVDSTLYPVPMDRLITAILLGVLTYDANLLILEPKR